MAMDITKFEFKIADVVKGIVPFDEVALFVRFHVCLSALYKKSDLSLKLNDLSDHHAFGDHANFKQEIKDALQSIAINGFYKRLKNIDKISTQIDELTNELINSLFEDDGSIADKDNFLSFLTQPEPSKRSDVLSTIALDHFITDFFLDNCEEKTILFPYMQSGFLPYSHALKYPRSKVTVFELNETKFCFCVLLKELFGLRNLNLIRGGWLQNSHIINEQPILYDKVINLCPLGMRLNEKIPDSENYPKEFNRSERDSVVYEQYKTLRHLKDDGSAILLTTRSFSFAERNVFKFVRRQLIKNTKINAVFQLPSGLMASTMIETLLFNLEHNQNSNIQFLDVSNCFSKSRNLKLDYSTRSASEILKAFRHKTELVNQSKLVDLNFIPAPNYELDPKKYVDNSELAQKLRRLLSNYESYDALTLDDAKLSKSIIKCSQLEDYDYKTHFILPKIKTKKLKTVWAEDEIKKDYFAIELNTDVISIDYLCHFLKGELGQLTLEMATRAQFIPTLTLKDVCQIKVPVPPLRTQQSIATAFDKLDTVNDEIGIIKDEINSSPNNVEDLIQKLDDILSALTEVSDAEKAFSKILMGEGELIEFKETFSLDVRRSMNDKNYKVVKEDKIEHSCLKTMAAFMNAKGGDLFIGVNDDAVVTGVDEEIDKFYKGSLDKYLLHLNNRIQERFETPVMTMLSIRPLKLNEKTVINVNVSPSNNDPIFLKPNSDFYVRSTPATEKLTGNGMFAYIKERFSLSQK